MDRLNPNIKPRRRFRGPRLPANPMSLTLTEAATRQIDVAIDALERGKFEIALTLAGAAEGMIKRDGYHLFPGLRDNPRLVDRIGDEKARVKLLNRELYWLKHGGADEMQIECFDAAMMIARAASKLEAKDWTPKMEDFRNWFLKNLDAV